MAIQSDGTDNIEIVLSPKMDEAALAKAVAKIDKQIGYVQNSMDTHFKRIFRLGEQNANVMSKYHKEELQFRNQAVKQHEQQLKLLEKELTTVGQISSSYKVSGEALRNGTSLMGSLTGNTKKWAEELDRAAIAATKASNALGLQKGSGGATGASLTAGNSLMGSLTGRKATPEASTDMAALQQRMTTVNALQKQQADEFIRATTNSHRYNLELRKASIENDLHSAALQGNAGSVKKLNTELQAVDKQLSKNKLSLENFTTKLVSTAQYAIAGTMLYKLANAAQAVGHAFLNVDLQARTMSAVLGENLAVSRGLTRSILELGEVYGGVNDEILNVAMSLGRAGIATEDITKATEVTLKMARLTGDSFNDASDAIIAYSQVFSKNDAGQTVYTMEQLGDKLAYVANVSRLSTKDINTFSNYALAAGKAAGLTVDAVGGMAAAFSNAGVNASTIGTQIRSFTKALTDTAADTQLFFNQLGVNQRNLLMDLQRSADGSVNGISQSNDALLGFVRTLRSVSDTEFSRYTADLDIHQRDVLVKMRQSSDNIAEYVKKSQDGVRGQLNETAVIMESFVVRIENAWNTVLNTLEHGLSSWAARLSATSAAVQSSFNPDDKYLEYLTQKRILEYELLQLGEANASNVVEHTILTQKLAEVTKNLIGIQKGMDPVAQRIFDNTKAKELDTFKKNAEELVKIIKNFEGTGTDTSKTASAISTLFKALPQEKQTKYVADLNAELTKLNQLFTSLAIGDDPSVTNALQEQIEQREKLLDILKETGSIEQENKQKALAPEVMSEIRKQLENQTIALIKRNAAYSNSEILLENITKKEIEFHKSLAAKNVVAGYEDHVAAIQDVNDVTVIMNDLLLDAHKAQIEGNAEEYNRLRALLNIIEDLNEGYQSLAKVEQSKFDWGEKTTIVPPNAKTPVIQADKSILDDTLRQFDLASRKTDDYAQSLHNLRSQLYDLQRTYDNISTPEAGGDLGNSQEVERTKKQIIELSKQELELTEKHGLAIDDKNNTYSKYIQQHQLRVEAFRQEYKIQKDLSGLQQHYEAKKQRDIAITQRTLPNSKEREKELEDSDAMLTAKLWEPVERGIGDALYNAFANFEVGSTGFFDTLVSGVSNTLSSAGGKAAQRAVQDKAGDGFGGQMMGAVAGSLTSMAITGLTALITKTDKIVNPLGDAADAMKSAAESLSRTVELQNITGKVGSAAFTTVTGAQDRIDNAKAMYDAQIAQANDYHRRWDKTWKTNWKKRTELYDAYEGAVAEAAKWEAEYQAAMRDYAKTVIAEGPKIISALEGLGDASENEAKKLKRAQKQVDALAAKYGTDADTIKQMLIDNRDALADTMSIMEMEPEGSDAWEAAMDDLVEVLGEENAQLFYEAVDIAGSFILIQESLETTGETIEDFLNAIDGLADSLQGIIDAQQGFLDTNYGAVNSNVDTVAYLQERFYQEVQDAEDAQKQLMDAFASGSTEAVNQAQENLAKQEQEVLDLGQQLIDMAQQTYGSTDTGTSIVQAVLDEVEGRQGETIDIQSAILDVNREANAILSNILAALTVTTTTVDGVTRTNIDYTKG